MKHSIEQLLMAAGDEPASGSDFTARIMKQVQAASPARVVVAVRPAKKRLSFGARLRRLSMASMVLMIVAVLATLSGTAYAVYVLWPKPVVRTQPAAPQYGRSQVTASVQNCAKQSGTSSFELKKNSTLTAEEIPKVIQARCEREVIQKWAQESGFTDSYAKGAPFIEMKAGDISTKRDISFVASRVDSLSPTQIALGGDEYNSPKQPLPITPATRFFAAGNEIAQSDIKLGDAVLFIKKTTIQFRNASPAELPGSSLRGDTIDETLTHVIKVDLPFEYYGPSKQNQLIERKPCYGNEQDTCVDTGGIDLYENLGIAFDIQSPHPQMMRSLRGTIEEHNGRIFKVKSSSGRIFTVQLPYDIITRFNTMRSAGYNNIKIGVGDTLQLNYVEFQDQHSTTLGTAEIQSVVVAIDFIRKDEPLKKY